VGGEGVEVVLLLPPGVEPHSFEPKPEDLARIARADLFIYTGTSMEPWADKLVRGGGDGGRPVTVATGDAVRYLSAGGQGHEGHDHGPPRADSRDPHVWLDFDNARTMVDAIAAGLAKVAPGKRAQFQANAAAYGRQLAALDQRYRQGLATCRTREFIHGGHFAFAYLAERYRLTYLSAYAVTADSEPSPRRLAELVKAIRGHGLKAVFYEELLSPRVAETIAAETGASLYRLHGAHNVTREELAGGVTYLGLMEQNLVNLEKGLECGPSSN
jgi:zinc transport system substrate-binding protein